MTDYICTHPDNKDRWCHYCCKDCSDRWSCMSLCRIYIQNFKAECEYRVPQKLCINCKSRCVWAGKDGEPEHKKCLVGYTPITNADRIRSMSDEELAKWIAFETEGTGFDSFEEFEKGWLEWLKEEVEDD